MKNPKRGSKHIENELKETVLLKKIIRIIRKSVLINSK